MNISKILALAFTTSALLIFTACGGGSGGGTTSAADPTDDSSSNIVPKTINVSIPDGLKSTRGSTLSKASLQKTTDTIESRGYTQLKSTIKQVEDTVKGVKKNMVYLSNMMTDIQTACEGIAINVACTIPAGQISLTVTSDIETNLNDLENEFNSADADTIPPVNTELVMGKILYTQFDSTHTYQQDIVLDLQPTLTALGLTVNKQLETMRWSDDNNSVETISDVDDSFGSYNMHLVYKKELSGTSKMQISNTYSFVVDNQTATGNFSFDMNDSKDINNTIQVNIAGSNTYDSITDTFNENGEIGDNGGFLISRGSFTGIEFAEKETFDKDGSILQSKYCEVPDTHPDTTCNINDQSTWHTFDNIFGIDSSDFVDQDFEDHDFGDDEFSVFESTDLKVEGGALQDGICQILPPSFDTSNLPDAEGIAENTIGNIFSYEDDTQGILYDKNHINNLDTLKVICFYNIANGIDAEFTELTGTDRPTLSLAEGGGE